MMMYHSFSTIRIYHNYIWIIIFMNIIILFIDCNYKIIFKYWHITIVLFVLFSFIISIFLICLLNHYEENNEFWQTYLELDTNWKYLMISICSIIQNSYEFHTLLKWIQTLKVLIIIILNAFTLNRYIFLKV